MLEETVPVSYGTSRTRLIIPCWERGWFYWLDRTVKINWSDLNHSFNPTNICRYIVENMSSGNYDKIFTTIWNWSFELLFFFRSLKCWYLLIVQTFSLFDGYCIYFFKQIIMSCHIYLILYSSCIIIFSCQNITKITFVRMWFNEAPQLSISTSYCAGPLYAGHCTSYIDADISARRRGGQVWVMGLMSSHGDLFVGWKLDRASTIRYYIHMYTRISLSMIEKACTSSFGIVTNRFNS